jgi:hypothetical protein
VERPREGIKAAHVAHPSVNYDDRQSLLFLPNKKTTAREREREREKHTQIDETS